MFRLNEIFRIIYAYIYMYAIDYKVRKSHFKILMFDNNN